MQREMLALIAAVAVLVAPAYAAGGKKAKGAEAKPPGLCVTVWPEKVTYRPGDEVTVTVTLGAPGDDDPPALVLAAGEAKEGPGPLVSSIAGRNAAFPIPVTVVPYNLSDEDIASLS